MRRTALARASAAVLLCAAVACTDLQELFPELPTSDSAIVLAFCKWVKGPSPSVFEVAELAAHLSDIAECGTRLAGRYSGRTGMVDAALAGASALGTTATEMYVLAGRTRAGQLPRWRVDVPPSPGDTGSRTIEASVGFSSETYGDPKKWPAKVRVTLFDVNEDGERSRVKRLTVKLAKGKASAVFGPLPRPTDHYQLEFRMRGRKADPGLLIYSAGVRDATIPPDATAAQRRPFRIAPAMAAAESSGLFLFQSHAVDGKAGGKQFGKFVGDMLPTSTSPKGGGRSVAAGIFAMDDELQATAKGPRIIATLFEVDADGKRSRVGVKRARYSDGGAQVEFDGLPAPDSHYQVQVKLRGTATDGGLTILAAEATSTARTALERVREAMR